MTKIASKGAAVQLSIATVYTTIGQVRDFDGPDAEVETWDATALDSGVGREFKPTGHVNGGTVSGTLWFDPVLATHQAMTDLITTPAVASWKNIWSDTAATVWPYSGVLTSFTPSASVGEGLSAAFSIKLDGMVSYPT